MKTNIDLSLDKNHWLEIQKYLRNLPEKPSVIDLEKVIYLAKHHEFWLIREKAVEVLGRTQYDFEELLRIAAKDKFICVRLRAENWIIDYDIEIANYRSQHA